MIKANDVFVLSYASRYNKSDRITETTPIDAIDLKKDIPSNYNHRPYYKTYSTLDKIYRKVMNKFH